MMTINIPATYTNFGDMDFVENGGIFAKQVNDTTYHVIQFVNMAENLGLENEWVELNDGFVDVSEWNRTEELSSHGFENESEVSDDMLATIIFENHGAIEFGDERNFDSVQEALDCMELLFR